MDNRLNDICKTGVLEVCRKSTVFLTCTDRRAELKKHNLVHETVSPIAAEKSKMHKNAPPLLLHFDSMFGGDRAEDMPVPLRTLWTD